MHPAESIRDPKGRLAGKQVVLALTGSIGIVKAVELARALIRDGAAVQAVMSDGAQGILTTDAMEFATGRKVVTRTGGDMAYLDWCGAQGKADLVIVLASANTTAKLAAGISDSPVTLFASAALGSGKPVLVVPLGHRALWKNPAVRAAFNKLSQQGVGTVAHVAEGAYKMPSLEWLVLETARILGKGRLKGKKVVVSGGSTEEDVDGVRVLTNRASGRTGELLAREAYRQGAEVIFLHNKKGGGEFGGIWEINFRTIQEWEERLFHAVSLDADATIIATAAGDFEVKKRGKKLSSKRKQTLALIPYEKTVQKLRKAHPKLWIGAFKLTYGKTAAQCAAEGRKMRTAAKLDLVVANRGEEAMGREKTQATLIRKKGKAGGFKGGKEKLVQKILKEIK